MLHHDGKPWLTPHPHMEDVAIFESPEGKTFEIDTGPGLPTCSIVVSRAPHPEIPDVVVRHKETFTGPNARNVAHAAYLRWKQLNVKLTVSGKETP